MTKPLVEPFECVRFRCPHCRRSFANKSYAQRHADQCWVDVANKTCKTCEHRSLPCCSIAGAEEICEEGAANIGVSGWVRDCPSWKATIYYLEKNT